MASKSAKYRDKLKILNPKKYEEMLSKARERNKRNREKRKQKWETEPRTRGIQQEIEKFRQKQRDRWHHAVLQKEEKSRENYQKEDCQQPEV